MSKQKIHIAQPFFFVSFENGIKYIYLGNEGYIFLRMITE